MKGIFKILIPLVILGGVGYYYRDVIRTNFFPPAPCSQPIPYNLGTFDTKFGISKDYFLTTLRDAEAIWEKPKGDYPGKDLFVYSPSDTSINVLKINLIYDYRQEATNKLASLGIVVKDDRASYDTLKAKFTSLQAKYEVEKSAFTARVEAFNKEQDNYEQQVKYWNSKGGAPKKEYDQLEAERLALQNESKDLEVARIRLNSMVDEINALVVSLNRLVSVLNLSVKNYNTVGASRGESFEEGLYESNGMSRDINIYEFSSKTKLKRVLAHEFGHALGLDHLDDPKAIMYSFNQGTNTALSAADLSALKILCQIK